MGRFVGIIIVFVIFQSIILSADPLDGLDYQSESVATSNIVSAGMINPAGLAFFSSIGVRYSHSFTDSSYKGDDALMINSRRGFFGIEWLNHSSGKFRRKYTIAMGDRLAPNFYIGLSYDRFNGNTLYNKKNSWKIGLLYHARPSIALGLTVDRLNEPRFQLDRQERLYRPGIAVRPFGKKYSFSSDARWIEGESLSKLNSNFRAAIGPFKKLSFSIDYATEGLWRLGFTYDLEQTKIGTQGRYDRGREFAGGSYFIELGASNYGSAPRSAGTGVISFRGDIVEEPAGKKLFGHSQRSFFNVISALRKGANDPSIKALFIRLDNARLNFASAQEIRSAIMEYRKNGKNVTLFFDNGGNLSYYIGSAADEIYMSPSGYLELKGISATATFYAGAMEKLGVKAQVIRTGPHKTYADAYTECGLTDAAREQLEWLLDDLYDQFVKDISSGRKIVIGKVKEFIDNGPYTAKEAYAKGLIDGLMYYDDLFDNDDPKYIKTIDLYKHYSKDLINTRWSEPKNIALVYADGGIRSGKSGRGLLGGKSVGSSTLARALKKVRNDRNIKAVVLRVNSPGGGLFASDEIYRQIELLKGRKPLIVSMAGVAASGGYYISMAGDDIIALPGTITGSIGVVAGKPDLSGFYEKIGVNKETIKRGKHADILSFNRPATNEELSKTQLQIEQYYDDFVSKVSAWRNLEYDSVNAIAGGRVWTGRQALKRGLIDSYGGIWEAVELARQKAGIDPEDKLIIEPYPKYGYYLFGSPLTTALGSGFAELFDFGEISRFSLKLPYNLSIE